MTSLFTKSKIITLSISLLIIIITSMLFIYGENKLGKTDIQTSILLFDGFDEARTEDYYREKLGNYEDSLIILKKDAMVNIVSSAIKEQLGYSDSDILNKNLFQYIHPKDLPFFANSMIDIIHDAKMVSGIGPFRIKNSEGQYHMYIADGYPLGVDGGEVSGIALVVKDIAEPVGNK